MKQMVVQGPPKSRIRVSTKFKIWTLMGILNVALFWSHRAVVGAVTAIPTDTPTHSPTVRPSTCVPTISPTNAPSEKPSLPPTAEPTLFPTPAPTLLPTTAPSAEPSMNPTFAPTFEPSFTPTKVPTYFPTSQPTSQPIARPTTHPSRQPTGQPSSQPSRKPTVQPYALPTSQPTRIPSSHPSKQPSSQPSSQPTRQPTNQPTHQPITVPTSAPSTQPSTQPSHQPTGQPTHIPTSQPNAVPTTQPSDQPQGSPTAIPSTVPLACPTLQPSGQPTNQPSGVPSSQPSIWPSSYPSTNPTTQPSISPSRQPIAKPSSQPSKQPSSAPSSQPSLSPTAVPTMQPTMQPSSQPSDRPSIQPSTNPSSQPSRVPTIQPTCQPSAIPTGSPTAAPTGLLECKSGYKNVRFPSKIECVACEKGFYSPGGKVTNCTQCLPGFYTSTDDSKCNACPFNTYQPNPGSRSCISCAPRYITGSTASTSAADCVNPSTSFIAGSVGLIVSMLVIWTYLYHGRLHLIAFSRYFRLIRKLVIVALATSRAQDLVSQTNSIILSIIKVKSHNKYMSEASQVILKQTIFAFLSLVILFIVVLSYTAYGLIQIVFNALVIYRSFRYFLPMTRQFKREANYLIDSVAAGLGLKSLAVLLYPIVFIADAIASININFSAVDVSCSGAQSPLYLLMNLIIVGVVVILIRSNAQVYWDVSLTQVSLKAASTIFNQYYVSRNTISSVVTVLMAIIFNFIPQPLKIMQLLLSFVSVGYFFSENGRSPSNQNCDNYASGGADTFLAIATTLFVYTVISPVIYLLAQVLVPCFELPVPPPMETTQQPPIIGMTVNENSNGMNSVDMPSVELQKLQDDLRASSIPSVSDYQGSSVASSSFQQDIESSSVSRATNVFRDSSVYDRNSTIKTSYASPMVQTILRYVVTIGGALFSLDWLYFKIISLFIQRLFYRIRKFSLLDHFTLLRIPIEEDEYLQDVKGILDNVKEQFEAAMLPWTPWFVAWSDVTTTYRKEKQEQIQEELQQVKILQELEMKQYPSFVHTAVKVQLSLRRRVKKYIGIFRKKIKLWQANRRRQNNDGQNTTLSSSNMVSSNDIETRAISTSDSITDSLSTTQHDNNDNNNNEISLSSRCEDICYNICELIGLRLCIPASYLIFFQLFSTHGKLVWKRVWKNYVHIAYLSIGIWTEEIVKDFHLMEDYRAYDNMVNAINDNLSIVSTIHQTTARDELNKYVESQKLLAHSTTTASKQLMELTKEMLEHKVALKESLANEKVNKEKSDGISHKVTQLANHAFEVHDAIIRVSNDKKFVFERYVSSMVSMRVVLLQLIPFCTVWSTIAVQMAGTPIAIFSQEMKDELIPLVVKDPFSRARNYWEDDYRALLGNDHPHIPVWKVAFLGIYLFIRQSRAIQIAFILLQNIATLLLVFVGWDIKQNQSIVSAMITQFLIQGVAYSLYLILLLHKYMYPRKADASHQVEVTIDNNDHDNETNEMVVDGGDVVQETSNPLTKTLQTPTNKVSDDGVDESNSSEVVKDPNESQETITVVTANPMVVNESDDTEYIHNEEVILDGANPLMTVHYDDTTNGRGKGSFSEMSPTLKDGLNTETSEVIIVEDANAIVISSNVDILPIQSDELIVDNLTNGAIIMTDNNPEDAVGPTVDVAVTKIVSDQIEFQVDDLNTVNIVEFVDDENNTFECPVTVQEELKRVTESTVIESNIVGTTSISEIDKKYEEN